MRSLSRVAMLGTLTAALVAVPGASAANSGSAAVSPNKGGTLTVGAPTTFKVKVSTPDTAPDPSGNLRLQAITANLPTQLLFNTVPFKPCSTTSFIATKSCPSSSKLGTATVLANGGPEVGVITATTDLYFGTGFTVLARVQADKPAIIDEAVVGALRSSGFGVTNPSSLYGLQLYIPIPAKISEPISGLFPTVTATDATFKGPTKSVRLPGEKKKSKLPLVGLAPCKGALAFQVNVLYTDAVGLNTTKTDSAAATAKCKK